MYHVYILRCSDGSLYTGFTADLPMRVGTHKAGRGADFTVSRRPVVLVYSEVHLTRAVAIRRERQLKGWTHRKKEALIAGDLKLLSALSRRSC